MMKRNKNSGFTMAELLVVVGIVIALSAVSFVGVARYQRSMAQLERDTIAKELFVAVQNHLTTAEGQGFLTSTLNYGNCDTTEADNAGRDIKTNMIHYLVVNGGTAGDNVMLNMMLPFGAIDETVRAGGSYIIRYQPNPATVLDVFYCEPQSRDKRFGHSFTDGEYQTALTNLKGSDKAGARRNWNKAVVGWYGAVDALQAGHQIETPTIVVNNGDRFTVDITDVNAQMNAAGGATPAVPLVPDSDVCIKLIITGETSKAQAAITVKGDSPSARVSSATGSNVYTVSLDDITVSGMHFAEIQPGVTGIDFKSTTSDDGLGGTTSSTALFIPGENITVQAVAYSPTVLANIAYSAERTTNSLFADISRLTPDQMNQKAKDETVTEPAETEPYLTAMIASIRHLENLDPGISQLDHNDTSENTLQITSAKQIDELLWPNETSAEGKVGFVKNILDQRPAGSSTTVNIYALPDDGRVSGGDGYLPVNPDYALVYDGLTVETIPPAGGSTTPTYKTSNHTINGIAVAYTGTDPMNAGLFGALADTTDGACRVSNLDLIDFSISTANGNAGALAGALTQSGDLATGVVNVSNVLAYNSSATSTASITGSGSVGGLIGAVDGGKAVIDKSAAAMVVTSSGTDGSAGGLIGTLAGGTVTDSYSGGHTVGGKYDKPATNVVAVANAGGLIGSASGTVSIEYCYSTASAQASDAAAGGLIGQTTGTDITVHYVYAIGRVDASTTDPSKTASKGTLVGAVAAAGAVKDKAGEAIPADDLKYAYAVDIDIDDLNDITKSGIDGTETTGGVTTVKTVALADAHPYDTTGHQSEDRDVTADDGTTTTETVYLYDYFTVCQLRKLGVRDGETLPDGYADVPLTQAHYGDWEKVKLIADTNLTIINAERLYAQITVPTEQLGDGRMLTVLIHGDSSGEEAYLLLKVDKSGTTDYLLSLSDITDIPSVTTPTDSNTKKTGDALTTALDGWLRTVRKAEKTEPLAANQTDDTLTEIDLYLDDITAQGGHFTRLLQRFIPGENLSVMVKGSVKAQDKMNEALVTTATDEAEIAAFEAEHWHYAPDATNPTETKALAARTNSLFADPVHKDESNNTVPGSQVDKLEGSDKVGIAGIANFRHLENLDQSLSRVNSSSEAPIRIVAAEQIKDLIEIEAVGTTPAEHLSWPGFVSTIVNGAVDSEGNPARIHIYRWSETTVATAGDDCYLPVTPGYVLAYDGLHHSISGVKVDLKGTTGENPAGLFGALSVNGSSVSNLKLIDFDIKTEKGNAGALIGTLSQTADPAVANVSNVLAVNTEAFDAAHATATVSTTEGSAGGLIGATTGGHAKVERSAAALIVSSSNGSAGGLIGTSDGGSVSGCYSGGHTEDAAYSSSAYNVTASSVAGGLIGEAGATAIDHSYSTCSVTGAQSGGFVGTSSGTINRCYATGLVKGDSVNKDSVTVGEGTSAVTTEYPKDGAFAYTFTGTATSCAYFEIINERTDAEGAYIYLTALGKGGTNTGITPFDAIAAGSTQSYYVSAGPDDWKVALPYDARLKTYYADSSDSTRAQYNLETVSQLYGSTGVIKETDDAAGPADYVGVHCGDWPAPEAFVFNR